MQRRPGQLRVYRHFNPITNRARQNFGYPASLSFFINPHSDLFRLNPTKSKSKNKKINLCSLRFLLLIFSQSVFIHPWFIIRQSPFIYLPTLAPSLKPSRTFSDQKPRGGCAPVFAFVQLCPLDFASLSRYSQPTMPSVFIKTYGCQMNERDSEAVAAQLVAKGYTLATSEAAADVVLLNTCSVRDMAEQKALNKMANLIGMAKKERPNQIFGFMGCMAQSRGAELVDKLPDVDLVVGTQKFHRTADYLDEILAGRRDKIVDTAAEEKSEAAIREHLLNGNAQKSISAFVSIMQGCNQYCTFCIVPYTRGEERSRTIPDIVAECRELVGRGVKEITLLGQIVTSYGKKEKREEWRLNGASDSPSTPDPLSTVASAKADRPSGSSLVTRHSSPFVQLLEAVHEIDGLERIRFTSPHPKGYGDDLVEAYARLPKLCESAHLPLQSGSDRLLKIMHRGYTRERFLGLIKKLRRTQPGIGISTDIIVGFPGETEDDFEQTLSLAREVEFDMAYIFKYSPRRDTPAADMPGQLSTSVKEERNERLLRLVNEIAARNYEKLVGSQVQILVEGPSKKNPARMMGRTRCNKIVVFDGSERHRGQLMDVKITRAGSFTLYGDPDILD
jgi:tRNA-2-methylthio-N6-dimethylallyladenosine synthase